MFSGLGVAASGVAGILGFLFSLASWAITIALGVYIYRDANKRNMNGTLWLILVLISFVPAIFVYLIVRDDDSSVECPNCKTVVKGNNTFCPKCGTEVKK